MIKSADVLEIKAKDIAKVMLYKHKKCHGCGSCNKHLHPGSIFDAANPVHAKVGEMVDVRVIKKFSTTEFFIVYILPIVAFFGGLFLGTAVFPGERGAVFSVVLAFAFLVAAIVVNVSYRKNYHPNYTVSIVKVIKPAEPRL